MPNNSQQWAWRHSSDSSQKSHGRSDKKRFKSAAERQKAYRDRERIKKARLGLGTLKRRPMPAWQRMQKMRRSGLAGRIVRPYQIHMSKEQLEHWKRTNIF